MRLSQQDNGWMLQVRIALLLYAVCPLATCHLDRSEFSSRKLFLEDANLECAAYHPSAILQGCIPIVWDKLPADLDRIKIPSSAQTRMTMPKFQ